MGKLKALWRLIRAYEWWNYKIPLALGAAFAVAWAGKIPFSEVILPALLIVLAGFSAGIYASVFNDFMDMEQDRGAGKITPMINLPHWQRVLVIVVSLSLMLMVSCFLWHLPRALTCFLLIWAGYTAYSLPPIRLKERGVLGILCIAIGEHVLAALLAVFVLVEITGCAVSLPWLCAVTVWAIAFGCRGILWHQLNDVENDRMVGCTTMGAVLGPVALRRFGEWFIFPMEILAFGTVMVLSGNRLAWIFLAIHCLLEWFRYKDMSANIIIVAPKPNARFAFFEYYQLFFPMAFLLSALATDKSAVFLIALFCLLFAAPIALSLHHVIHICRWRLVQPFLERAKTLKVGVGKGVIEIE